VIVGGMTFGTAFTLFVVPTVYTYLARKTPTLAHLQDTGEDAGSPEPAPSTTAG
jgi:multidrug efflux pump